MDKKGQIMAMDFLISVAAVTLAIGLMIQFAEIKTYNEKDDIAWLELKEIAESAADRLVGSPDIVCELVDTYDETTGSYYSSMNDVDILHICYLDNCIPKINAVGHKIEKADLGIPAGYDCDIDNDAVSAGTLQTGCADNLPADTDYYSITKKVVLLTGTGHPENKNRIAKVDWETCMGNTIIGSCTLEESDTILKVWKT